MNVRDHAVLVLFLITAFLFLACNKPPTAEKNQTDQSAIQTSSNAADAPFDLQFLDTMTVHHQVAIDMAKMCQGKAQHPELLTSANNIAAAQQEETAKMKQWRDDWFAGQPSAMNAEMDGMKESMKDMDMNELGSLTGNTFDLEFLRQMIPHHTGALLMANTAFQKAEKNETKMLATDILKTQSAEIRQMQEWQKAWSK